MVTAAYEAGGCGAGVVLGEFGVGVGRSFCCLCVSVLRKEERGLRWGRRDGYLDDNEASAAVVGGLVVYVGLVMRDVETCDRGALFEGIDG